MNKKTVKLIKKMAEVLNLPELRKEGFVKQTKQMYQKANAKGKETLKEAFVAICEGRITKEDLAKEGI